MRPTPMTIHGFELRTAPQVENFSNAKRRNEIILPCLQYPKLSEALSCATMQKRQLVKKHLP
jgi:hypothetical protein